MELGSVVKFEVQKNKNSILIFSVVIGLFVLMLLTVFNPEMFANVNDIIAGMPEEVIAMLGGLVDLSTFEGFFCMYIFEFSWMWYGIYLILKVAQDIPGEIENKTIDLVLSKPVKRWEYVLGKQLQHIITIITVVLFSALCAFGAVSMNSNINIAEIDVSGIVLSFAWLVILLLAIESTVLLISTILGGKKATAIGFGIVIGLWFISAYKASIPVDNVEYASIFTYFNPRTILIDGVMTNVVRDILFLLGYTAVLSAIAVIYFNKRDIPV